MKLSEAILLGSTMGPQLRYKLNDDAGGSCALGAAMLAIGRNKYVDWTVHFSLSEEWQRRELACPACGSWHGGALPTVITLNNEHRWTRERIAEWVSTIEPEEKPADAAVTREREAEAVETPSIL